MEEGADGWSEKVKPNNEYKLVIHRGMNVRLTSVFLECDEEDDEEKVRVFIKRGVVGERAGIAKLSSKHPLRSTKHLFTAKDGQLEFFHSSNKHTVVFHGITTHTLSVEDICVQHPPCAEIHKLMDNDLLSGYKIKKASPKTTATNSSPMGTVSSQEANFPEPVCASKKRKQSIGLLATKKPKKNGSKEDQVNEASVANLMFSEPTKKAIRSMDWTSVINDNPQLLDFYPNLNDEMKDIGLSRDKLMKVLHQYQKLRLLMDLTSPPIRKGIKEHKEVRSLLQCLRWFRV